MKLKRIIFAISLILSAWPMPAQFFAPPRPVAGMTPGAPPPFGGSSPMTVNAPLSSPDWQNHGVISVMACGYDAQGIWRTIPLKVRYNYNGVQYDVTVLSAWNPWSDMWNTGVDTPAFNTNYFINGSTFDFYTNLSTGTYYFNL